MRRLARPALVLSLAAITALGGCAPQTPAPVLVAGPIAITDPTRQVAESPRGMVASASRFATEAGARVLAEGGNAVDAAAATPFTLAVTEPTMSGLGGRTSIMIRTPAGEYYGIDGLNQVPRAFRDGAPAGYPLPRLAPHRIGTRLPYATRLGGAGDSRIITAVIQTLSRAVDQQMPLERAVAAPRLHPMGATTLTMERDSVTRIAWSDADMERLKALGFTLELSPSTFYGRVHAVTIDEETRRFIGVAEPRGFGAAAGPVR